MSATAAHATPEGAGDAPRVEGYELVRELGRGAMGVVYLARDTLLERDVALKVFAGGELSPEGVERFLREARAMARLSHPNVVTVYRAGVSGAVPFVVMELLHGRSLDAVVRPEGLAPERLLAIALGAARGLAAAHARGVVHRDVKPSNLFETDDGGLKVLDFGIAKLVDAHPRGLDRLPPSHRPIAFEDTLASDPDAARVAAEAARAVGVELDAVRTGITGTAAYMAPEVWRSEGGDAASDVWSLGATLYHLATGRAPFAGSSLLEIASQALTAPSVPPVSDARPDLPQPLAEVIDACLSTGRARRFASAQEVVVALDRVARGQRPAAPNGEPPYPGLRTMDARDRDRFFGRDDDVERVLERLRAEPMVVLVGASGSGKSSLARAGVAPRVAEGALGGGPWRVVTVTPGRSPVSALADALADALTLDARALARDLVTERDALVRALRESARGGGGTLVVIDQLEELATTAQPAERDALAAALALLVDVAPRGARVLATARGDVFDRLGALGDLGPRLGRATELVRPLGGAALREAVTTPARAAGYGFEDPATVDALLAEAGEGPESLPLVAFALRQWWERRDEARALLTASAWRALGGVAGALHAHAEAVYAALSEDEREAARTAFTRMVGGDGTRRYAARAELDEAARGGARAVGAALEAFSRAWLVRAEPGADDTLWTVTHESLARAWRRLRDWVAAGREDRALHEQLGLAARAWDRAGRRHDLLWRASLLAELARWRELYDDTLDATERAFADASRSRARARRRLQLAGLGALLLAAGGATAAASVVAVRARRDHDALVARTAVARARAREASVERSMAAAYALREVDPTAALAWIADAAARHERATPVMRALALGIADQGVAVRVPCTSTVALREDGAAAACAVGATVHRIDLGDGTVTTTTARRPVRLVALSPTDNAIFWVDDAGVLQRWEAGAAPVTLATDQPTVGALVPDPDGARATARPFERPARRAGELHEGDRCGLVVNPDDTVWVAGRLSVAGPLGVRRLGVTAGVVDPGCRRAALVDVGGALHVYGAPTGAATATRWLARPDAPWPHDVRGPALASLPDGAVAVAAPRVGVRVLERATGRVLYERAAPDAVAVSLEGSTALLGLADGRGVLVDLLARSARESTLLAGAEPVAVAVSPTGARVAAVGPRGDAVWREATRAGWPVIPTSAFRELRGARALATQGDELALGAAWLGVVHARGSVTLAQAPAGLDPSRVTALRFVGRSRALAGTDEGSIWYARCDDDRCGAEWMGLGHGAVPIERDVALVTGDGGAVNALEVGRRTATAVVHAHRIAALSDVPGHGTAVAMDGETLTLAGPPERPVLVSVALPPEDARAFGRWVRRLTNVEVSPEGALRVAAVPRAVP